jgi:hypothetical protein
MTLRVTKDQVSGEGRVYQTGSCQLSDSVYCRSMRDRELVADVMAHVRREPVLLNWAQQVSIEDLFILLLKFTVASIPFFVLGAIAVGVLVKSVR